MSTLAMPQGSCIVNTVARTSKSHNTLNLNTVHGLSVESKQLSTLRQCPTGLQGWTNPHEGNRWQRSTKHYSESTLYYCLHAPANTTTTTKTRTSTIVTATTTPNASPYQFASATPSLPNYTYQGRPLLNGPTMKLLRFRRSRNTLLSTVYLWFGGGG